MRSSRNDSFLASSPECFSQSDKGQIASLLLSSNHVPVCLSFGSPPQARNLRLNFAWIVRFEPEDALDRGERTRSSTVRTFHQGDTTVSKSFEIDGNHHSRKRAFG